MRVTKRIKASGGANDPAALGLVDEAIEDTSGCLLMWAKAAATAEGSSSFHDDEPPVFPPGEPFDIRKGPTVRAPRALLLNGWVRTLMTLNDKQKCIAYLSSMLVVKIGVISTARAV